MEKLYKYLLKRKNWLLASLLAIMGFSCQEYDEEGPLVYMYGTPTATFQIKGKVVDHENKPVANAQIRITPNNEHGWMHSDTTQTDAQGGFVWKGGGSDGGSPYSSFRLITEMTDNENNNQWIWKNDTTTVNFSEEDMIEGSAEGWSMGNYEKEVAISLKEYVMTSTEPYASYSFYGVVRGTDGQSLAGVIIKTSPNYIPEPDPNKPNTYLAITNYNGQYGFALDLPAPIDSLTIHLEFYNNYWNTVRYKTDSTVIKLTEIPLSGGKDVFLGKGRKEVNFELPYKD